jgi:hypothetical protein
MVSLLFIGWWRFFRQKPFRLCHCAWRAIFARNRSFYSFMPLRVAGYFRQKPFPPKGHPVSGTFLRAGASPCTRNERRWFANARWSCLGCER